MLAYYVVKFFSWIMCVAPKCLRNLTAAILGGIAVVATPKWRMQMAAVNIQECLGVDQARAQQIAEKSLRRFGRMVVEVMRFPLLNKDNICYDLSKAFLPFANHKQAFTFEGITLTASQVKRINAIMQTCGFYDEAGEFSYLVGLPGKSGVGGGIAAVYPLRYSVAVWSPRLNPKGNSVMGIKALELLTTQTQESIF